MLLVCEFAHAGLQVLKLSLQIPVFIAMSLKALVHLFCALGQVCVFVLELRFPRCGIFQLLVLFCKRRLKLPDLRKKLCTDLGGELDVVYAISRLIPLSPRGRRHFAR